MFFLEAEDWVFTCLKKTNTAENYREANFAIYPDDFHRIAQQASKISVSVKGTQEFSLLCGNKHSH